MVTLTKTKSKNKTIFLALADTPNGHKYFIPFALLYLGNSLKKAGYNVEVRHFTEKKFDKFVAEICREKPLYVGFSTLTGKHSSYAANLSKKIKKIDKTIPICWGGVHPSLLSEQCLKEDYIDFVVNGDGEETVVEFANQLTTKKDFSKVKGLGYKKNGKIFVPERRFVEDLSTVRPDFSLINVEEYFTEFPEGCKRVLTYITSKGCPHGCTFCYNLNYNKRRWRPFSLENVKEDIAFLKEKYNIDGVFFSDDNFFVDKKRAFDILEHTDLPSASDVRMDYIDEDFLKKLKELKVVKLLVGVESGSEQSQLLMNKRYTVKYAIKIIRLLAKYHFRCHYCFVIALPTETFKDIKETIDLILYTIKIHKEATFTPGHYLPFPGTPLYYKAIELGFKPPNDTLGWTVLDRWDNKMDLVWSSVDSKFCYYVKWYSFFVAARVPLITEICRWRLKTMIFNFPADLKIFLFLYHFAYHSDFKLAKLVRIAARPFQFKLKLGK